LKNNVLYLFVLFVLLGCGAQNNPIGESSSASATSEPDAIGATLATSGSNILLPESVAIDFPNALKNSSNSSFNQKVNRIQKVIDSEKYNLELLKLAIDEIEEGCPESNSTCNFGKDEFRVNHNHQTVLLGEINFNKYTEENKSSYDLLLSLNDDIRVRYQWEENENSVFTTYLEGNSSLKLHYFRENNRSEASYINDNLVDEKNSFMINVESNDSSLYFLTSNHIKNNKQEFSTKLRVEDNILVENKESFFNFSVEHNASNDVGILGSVAINPFDIHIILLDYIESQDLKDGDYLVFDANITAEVFNLSEQLKLSIGSFSYLNKEVFGLILNEERSESVNEFKIIPLN